MEKDGGQRFATWTFATGLFYIHGKVKSTSNKKNYKRNKKRKLVDLKEKPIKKCFAYMHNMTRNEL